MPVLFESDGKTIIPFSEIHALQIISEFISGKFDNYSSYELNIILKDATRINIIDHNDIEQIRLDAQKISIFLGVPVWDITL
jgi:hypothetical protein